MKKIVLFSLFMIITLCSLTGCIKLNNKKYTCKGFDEKYGTYTNQTDYTVELKDDELINLYMDTNQQYKEEKEYQESCSNNKREAKNMNLNNNYVTYKIVCNDKEKMVTVKKQYNISKTLKENGMKVTLSHTLRFIKADGKFDLDGWKQSMSQNRMKCEW